MKARLPLETPNSIPVAMSGHDRFVTSDDCGNTRAPMSPSVSEFGDCGFGRVTMKSADDDDGMNVVGHDHRGINQNVGIVRDRDGEFMLRNRAGMREDDVVIQG